MGIEIKREVEQVFVFVYTKEKLIKVLGISDSKNMQSKLIEEGWVHTSTLDACVYLQYLHNECEDVDLYDELNSLSNPK